MADVVDSKVLFNGTRIYSARFTNVSDGTGEAAVAKVTLSGLTGPKGTAPTYTKVREILWSIQGFSSVRLFWDHTTDDEIQVLAPGNGYMNWVGLGGETDPQTAGGTGNILLTTAGAASGATYDITIVLELKGG
jgi:hypothetical protein